MNPPEIKDAVSDFIKSGTISEAKLKLLISQKDLSNIIHIRDLIKGNSLLHVCAESDMLDEVQRLLAAGASPKEPNNRGLRPEYMTKNADIRWLCVEGSLPPDKLQEMRELGIKVDRNAFCFSGYRYERLEDAIAFARRSPAPRS